MTEMFIILIGGLLADNLERYIARLVTDQENFHWNSSYH